MAFKDFDQFWLERQGEPVRLRVFGEDHALPAALPAAIMVYTMRLQAAGQENVPPQTILMMAEALFGQERLNGWVAKGLTVDQLGDLIKWATETYMVGDKPDTVNEGNR